MRPRKLRELRIAEGNRSKRPLPPPDQTKAGTPSKPSDLSEQVSAKWDELIRDISGVKLLYVTDGESVRELAESIVAYRTALHDIGGAYVVPLGEDGGMKPNPLWSIVDAAQKRAVRLLSEFGLTPSSRVKLTAAQPVQEENPLKAFLNKRSKNAG